MVRQMKKNKQITSVKNIEVRKAPLMLNTHWIYFKKKHTNIMYVHEISNFAHNYAHILFKCN